MQHRKFGRHDFEVSALGFGCMRLPVIDEDYGKIDQEKAIAMIRHAIDSGVNYIDTAYPYHKGTSEALVAKALKDGYRQKVRVATKMPTWLIKSYEDFEKYLSIQLQRLETDCIDFYLLHALDRERWDNLKNLDVFKFLEEARSQGRIKHIGFSFHDSIDVFKEIADSYQWDFCQIQYNYMDENYQAGTEGLKHAAARNMAVVIMEPLRGGRLVKDPPQEVKDIWNKAEVSRTPAEWALRWVWNHPEVTVVLSGMGDTQQVDENIHVACQALPESLTSKELKIISEARDTYKRLSKVGCTNCKYCMPCPHGVDIPGNFEIYNELFMYNAAERSKDFYEELTENKESASCCKECGLCETKCPQHLPIRKHLKEAHEALSK